MSSPSRPGTWQGTDAYEAYMGRWSRPIARAFLTWFAAPKAGRWLDVGCGTGALVASVLVETDPIAVLGIDPSTEFISAARAGISDPRAQFEVGDALALPIATNTYDAVVAGLVLNHVPAPDRALAEMVRVARPGALVGAYVWDYDGEMQLVRSFWEAARATDSDAALHDPRSHYAICRSDSLAALARSVGLTNVEVDAIDLPMHFQDFDDFWLPQTLNGPSAVQRYVSTLDQAKKTALQEHLRATLPVARDGTIHLIGRAWAMRGAKPAD